MKITKHTHTHTHTAVLPNPSQSYIKLGYFFFFFHNLFSFIGLKLRKMPPGYLNNRFYCLNNRDKDSREIWKKYS